MSNIIIKNSKVMIIHTETKKYFKKMLKIGKWRLYLTYDCKLKIGQQRDQKRGGEIPLIKSKLWKQNKGKCEMCGCKIGSYRLSQIHHVLPYSMFKQFENEERNMILLCPKCHKYIHKNVFLDCKMQTEKAKELGVNLEEYYGL